MFKKKEKVYVRQNLHVEAFTKSFMKKQSVDFSIGDTVRVHVKVIEGKKERVQIFSGIVIARKGSGISESFIVYRNAYGYNMERVFLLHSPRIMRIEVMRRGKTKRATLYNLRQATGKAARIKEDRSQKKIKTDALVEKEKIPQEEEKIVPSSSNEEEKKEKQ